MSQTDWLYFVLASLPAYIAPGPNNMLAIRHGADFGFWPAALAMTGRLPGYGLVFLAAFAGIGGLLLAKPSLLQGLSILGGFYIIFLGIRAMRASSQQLPEGSAGRHEGARAFMAEFTTALSNPKAILFATAFMAQFIQPDTASYAGDFARMTAAALALESIAALAYCGLGTLVGKVGALGGRLHLVTRLTGAVLALMGVALVMRALGSAP